MKYLCLICAENWMEKMPKVDAAQHFEEYREFTEDLRRNAASSSRSTGCNLPTPQPRSGCATARVSTTDGPYAETKEQFGGYYVIETRDLNEAIRVASRIPGARYGCVEVRPIAEDESTLDSLGLARCGW